MNPSEFAHDGRSEARHSRAELATATLVALMVIQVRRAGAARYLKRLAAHTKAAGKGNPPAVSK